MRDTEICNLFYGVQEVMLRRLKSEVMAQLPAKRRQIIRLPAPAAGDWANAAGDFAVTNNTIVMP